MLFRSELSFNISGVKSTKFPYAVGFESQQYHIVKHRTKDLSVVPNNTDSKTRLQTIKMELQSIRPKMTGQAHDMRFENINLNSQVSTRNLKCVTPVFDRMLKRDTSQTLINREIGHQFYNVNDMLVR